MKAMILVLPLMFLLAVVGTISASHEPEVFLNFNERGAEVNNLGTGGGKFIMLNAAGKEDDLHSEDGGGVSGRPGDRSFDNTAADAMSDEGGRCEAPFGSLGDQPHRITVIFWYKTEQNDGRGSLPVFKGQGDGWNVVFRFQDFQFRFNGHETDVQTRIFFKVNEWVFFALTFDGSVIPDTDNIFFYKGTKNIEPFVVSVQREKPETIRATLEKLTIGNEFDRNNSTFDAFMDNVRVFQRVLNAREIREIWEDDLVNAHPTPTASPTETPTPSPEESPTPTESPSPTHSPTPEETPTPSPEESPTPTESPSPTHSPTPEESPTPTESPTPEESPTPTELPTPEETPSPSPSPTPQEECLEVTSLALSISSVEMEVNETLEVVVSVKCQRGEKLSAQPIFAKKKGSKESKKRINLDKEVGVTNSEGKATFKILALKKGEAKVRFRSEEKDTKAILKIKIRS